MNESSKAPLVIALVVVVVPFLIFGGGAMTESMMSGGMMGHGWIGGFSWMWIPTLLTLGLGVLLGLGDLREEVTKSSVFVEI